MKKYILTALAIALCGCVDWGQIGIHPELRTQQFTVRRTQVKECLQAELATRHIFMRKIDNLPDRTEKFSLQDRHNITLAWLDISSLPQEKSRTEVNFYYSTTSHDIHLAVAEVIAHCETSMH